MNLYIICFIIAICFITGSIIFFTNNQQLSFYDDIVSPNIFPDNEQGTTLLTNELEQEKDNIIVDWEHTYKGLTRQEFVVTIKQSSTQLLSDREVVTIFNEKELSIDSKDIRYEYYELQNVSHQETKPNTCTFNYTHEVCDNSNKTERTCENITEELTEPNKKECGTYIDNNYYYEWIEINKPTTIELSKRTITTKVPLTQVRMFKVVVHTPMNNNNNKWGSTGKLSLSLDGNEFYDYREGHSSWWNVSYMYRKQINISSTNVDENLRDFPVMIMFNDTDLGTNALPNGNDIRFANETEGMSFEIENYTVIAGAGIGHYWVKVPTILKDSDTPIYIYYGNTTADAGLSGAVLSDVWSNNFIGVFHFTDTTSVALDSSGYGNGTYYGTLPTLRKGVIGNAQYFDGNGDYINIPAYKPIYSTYNVWLNVTNLAPYISPWSYGSASDYFGVFTLASSDFSFNDDINDVSKNKELSKYELVQGRYTSHTILLNASSKSVYQDSLFDWQSKDALYGLDQINANDNVIGHYWDRVNYDYIGEMSELRFSDVERNISWIKFEYENMRLLGSDLSFGSEELEVVPDTTPPNLVITFPSNNTNTSDTGIDINYTVSDDEGVGSCWYNNDSYTKNNTIPCGMNITNLTWSEGYHNVTLWVNDTSNNVNQTSVIFRVDTMPVCSLISVTPSDIEANSSGTFEILVNCTSSHGLNVTKIGDHYRSFFTMTVDSDGAIPNEWHIFYPDNNLAISSANISQRILRAVGRNESYWYESIGQTELDTNIYNYAVYDGEYGNFKIQSNGSNWVLFNISGQVETLVFKQSYPLNKENMEEEEKKEYLINNNDGLMVLFYDLERIKDTSNYTLISFANFNYTTTPNKNMEIYYCNQSYLDTTCSGDFTTGSCSLTPEEDNSNCVFLNTLPSVELDTRAFYVKNSSYVKDVYGIINQKIGGITTTNISYIYYRSMTNSGDYTIRYANGTSGTNINFNDSQLAFLSTDDGNTYTTLEGTPDIFINTVKSGDQFQLGVCVWDLLGGEFCNYNFYSDDIGDVNFPISNPGIQNYQPGIKLIGDETGKDEELNGTYNKNMTIHINIALDPDSVGNVTHNLTLENLDGSWNYTINSSFKSSDDSDKHIYFDTKNVNDGTYKMEVCAISGDDLTDVQCQTTYNNFTIDNTIPNLVITFPSNNSNTTDTGIDINYTVSDNLLIESCWYSNGSYTINTTLINCNNITTVTWSEGYHNVIIWVNDSVNNVNRSMVNFTVDNTPPIFTNLANQTILEIETLSYDINAEDLYLKLGTFSINWTANYSINKVTGVMTNTTELLERLDWFIVSVNDTLGNIRTSTFYINVTPPDTTPPTFTNIRNFTKYVNSSFSESITATDNIGIDSYKLNDTSYFSINKTTGLILNSTNLSRVEIHWINISVNDTLNNIISGIFYINITSIIPIVQTGLASSDMVFGYDADLVKYEDDGMRFTYRR